MSWWIQDHIAVNEDETQQLCSIEADTQSSIPAADQTATAGFIIVRGSIALVLDTGDTYKLNSSGTWVKQPSGVQLDLTGYATAQELTDGLAAKVDITTYTAGQAAQDNEIATKATIEDIYGIGVSIPSNSDLNNYRTGGNYYVVNNAIASTIANIPVTGSGFRLIVRTMNTSSYSRQEFYKVNQPEIMYVRTYNGTWSAWYKFEGVQV